MVHLFTQRNILHTIFYAVFTFFLAPFVLVEKTRLINMKNTNDPCMVAFIIGFIISLILWNKYTKKFVYE